MEHSTAVDESLNVWIQLLRLVFVLVIPAVLVVVARYRSSWLLRAWLGTWLVLISINLIWFPYTLEYAPLAAGVDFVLVGIAIGPPALWLHLGRRHPVFSRLAVQFFGAVAAFIGGIALVGLVQTLGN